MKQNSVWNVVGLTFLFLTVLVPVSQGEQSEAMKKYLAKDEPAYTYEIRSKDQVDVFNVIDVALTSQTWQGIDWKHQLTIVVPQQATKSGFALLFISGGSLKDGEPKWSDPTKDDFIQKLAPIAKASGSPIAVLKQVPNQPLYEDRKEDALIAYTFKKYLETKDDSWPLLLPMTKSAVKAMDTIQAVCEKELNLPVKQFVVSGASKRGWTTWLTGANDKRVAAIAPMVIDTLNLHLQMKKQMEAWGVYSEQIQDYTELKLQEKLEQPDGKVLASIVDPYAYRDLLTMPKMIIMGNNDPYWTADAVKNYYDDLVGYKCIHYTPNAGHDLGGGKEAVEALTAFFVLTTQGGEHPLVDWSSEVKDGKLHLSVRAAGNPEGARWWTTTSENRDFRKSLWLPGDKIKEPGESFTLSEDLPKEGFKAVYIEVQYPSPAGGTYSKCTRVFVLGPDGVID